MNTDLLNRLACEFRRALEIVADEGLYGRMTLFSSFPRGCCTYASDLLAEYLTENGFSRKRIQSIASETIEEGYTHCWLTIDDAFFVDITADQFNGKLYFEEYEPIPPCCIVGCDTYLYERFDNQKRQCSCHVGINSYNENVSTKLQVVYDAAIQQIKANAQRR